MLGGKELNNNFFPILEWLPLGDMQVPSACNQMRNFLFQIATGKYAQLQIRLLNYHCVVHCSKLIYSPSKTDGVAGKQECAVHNPLDKNLKEYYEIVGESRPLSGFFSHTC